MKKIFTKIFTLILTLVGIQSFAQSVLVSGDIVIVAYQYITSSPDKFAFVPLVDLQANTIINFTDNAFKLPDTLRTTEETMIWNSGANAIPAGTIITIMADTIAGQNFPICSHGSGNNELDGLSNAGDQITVYQGTPASPTFIAALTSNAYLTSGNTTAQTSYVPMGLINQNTAIGFPNNKVNGYYNCNLFPTSGSPATILASVNDSSHWIRANTIQTWPTCSYSVVTDAKQIKEVNTALKAFPNPSSTGVFNLTKNVNLQVYNMVGINVMNAVNTNTIDISGLSAGVYIVKTNNNEMIKIVKSN